MTVDSILPNGIFKIKHFVSITAEQSDFKCYNHCDFIFWPLLFIYKTYGIDSKVRIKEYKEPGHAELGLEPVSVCTTH